MPKKIDAFIFYNELEMLYYRLSVLYPHMDAFILVESTLTHTGNAKPLFFNENRERFAPFLDKIVHVVVENMIPNLKIENKIYDPDSEQWKNERYQRNSISLGIENYRQTLLEKGLDLGLEDVIFINDVDELLDPVALPLIEQAVVPVGGVVECPMDMYYYNLQTRLKEKWMFSKAISYEYWLRLPKIKEHTLFLSLPDLTNGVRLNLHVFRMNCPCGWHLSYFGDSRFIQNKIQQFGHQEYNSSSYTDLDAITEKIRKGRDLYGRDISLEIVPLELNEYLPPLPDSGSGFPFVL
jgi:beta-1,4-mannosyl-glycoprotein beta-1,4-N-acetylglucosaminyltransferase